MFPYAHAKPISDVSIHLFTESFHTSYLEVVNPSSNELIEFRNLVTVANAPTTTCEFFHPLLELRYGFCMWLCFKLMRS